MAAVAVDIRRVSKAFVLRHNRADTLKQRALGLVNRRLSERRTTLWALRGIDLAVARGERLALIGPNGSGKSTLLRLISGVLVPDEGEIRVAGRVVSLIDLGAGFHPELTGRENVFLDTSLHGLGRRETARLFDAIVDFSGLHAFVDAPMKDYSSGMYLRLAFSIAVHLDADILLVDEVLAVGDESFQRRCLARFATLADAGRTVVLVSHDTRLVQAMCDRACLLWRGRVVASGRPGEVVEHYRALSALPGDPALAPA